MLENQRERKDALADPPTPPESSSSIATTETPEMKQPHRRGKKSINNVDLFPDEPIESLPVFSHHFPKKKDMKAQIDKELEEAAKKER